MELWKIERFCETAPLEELRRVRAELERHIDAGRLSGTNAGTALRLVAEAIALRELFKEN